MSAQSIAERLRNTAPAVSRPKVAATMIEAANTIEALLEALTHLADTVFASGLTADNSDEWLAARAAIASAQGGGK